jgi:hypothetical protein
MKRLTFALFGVFLIGAALVPASFASPPTAPVKSFVAGPTPTPIPGIQKHG